MKQVTENIKYEEMNDFDESVSDVDEEIIFYELEDEEVKDNTDSEELNDIEYNQSDYIEIEDDYQKKINIEQNIKSTDEAQLHTVAIVENKNDQTKRNINDKKIFPQKKKSIQSIDDIAMEIDSLTDFVPVKNIADKNDQVELEIEDSFDNTESIISGQNDATLTNEDSSKNTRVSKLEENITDKNESEDDKQYKSYSQKVNYIKDEDVIKELDSADGFTVLGSEGFEYDNSVFLESIVEENKSLNAVSIKGEDGEERAEFESVEDLTEKKPENSFIQNEVSEPNIHEDKESQEEESSFDLKIISTDDIDDDEYKNQFNSDYKRDLDDDYIEDGEVDQSSVEKEKIVEEAAIENVSDYYSRHDDEYNDIESGEVIYVNLNKMIHEDEIDKGKMPENDNDENLILEEKEIENNNDKGYTDSEKDDTITDESLSTSNLSFKDKIVIDIPEEIQEKLPENFDLEPIDLNEAEEIANEEILILNEDDLIQEIESADLRPIEESNDIKDIEKETDLDKTINDNIEDKDDDDQNLNADRESNEGASSFFSEIEEIIESDDNIESEIDNYDPIESDEDDLIDSDIMDDDLKIIEDSTENEIEVKYDNDELNEKDKAFIESNIESKCATVITPPIAMEDEILDITDNIVILEDDSRLEEFIEKNIDQSKQKSMKKLLSYLDGLFEKLPEDVVKNFANSEYFDLYVKVMNDLGI